MKRKRGITVPVECFDVVRTAVADVTQHLADMGCPEDHYAYMCDRLDFIDALLAGVQGGMPYNDAFQQADNCAYLNNTKPQGHG